MRFLVDFCAGLGGIYEVALGTAASDASLVSCAVSVYNDTLTTRITAAAQTADEAADAVLLELRDAAFAARQRSRLERLPGSFRAS